MDSGHGDRHVRFGEERDGFLSKGNEIICQRLSDTQLQVHLGFLKHHHIYEISIPLNIPEHIPDNFDWILDASISNPYCSIKSYEKTDGAATLVIQFQASKVKLMKETLRLKGTSQPAIHLDLILLARVLGKGQGTPMLKDGIHYVGMEPDDESEASDWQGFE